MTAENQVTLACNQGAETREMVREHGDLHQCVHPNCGAVFGKNGLTSAVSRIYCVDIVQKLNSAKARLKIMSKGPRPGSMADVLIRAGTDYQRRVKEDEVTALTNEAINLGVYGKQP